MEINSRKLDAILAEKGLTKKDLGELSGIARQNISTITKRGTCSPKTAHKIANGLVVSVREFLDM